MTRPEFGDDLILGVLRDVRTIAMIGASPRPERPSHGVMRFLLEHGYDIFPVNPACVGETIHGQPVYATLAEVPGPIDMVDIFRNTRYAAATSDEALGLAREKEIKVIWMQIGVRDDAAAARATERGLTVIMERCPVIEYRRLQHALPVFQVGPSSEGNAP